ncbi:MAG: glycosyltransferase [Bacteroidetes bacterium]|nr:glycosyltransferase [Bacteroidota bacterium]
MRLLFLTTYYPPFLKVFYDQHPGFLDFTYKEMMDKLLDQYFADTGALHHYCIKHKFDSNLIIANCEPLQKRWAKENQVIYSEADWEKEIVLAQIKQLKPDVFYIESIFNYYGQFLKEVKSYCKFIVAWISTPISDSLKLNDIDMILSSTQDFVEKFRKMGIKSEYMLPAFDTRILDLLEVSVEKSIPFSFVGGWGHVHINRKKALTHLVQSTNIQLWGYGYRKEYHKRSLNYYKNILFPEKSDVLEAYKGEVWGLEMYKVLQQSLITFNIHESLLKGRVGNMRMFEATGVGTLIMNDNGINLADIFIPGKEIEVYDSLDEAVEKTNYYLNHPEKAIEIGLNAQRRTVKDYNYDEFVKQLSNHLNKL